MQQQPPGWYPNPANPTELRWWDGSTWTNHTAPMGSGPPAWTVTLPQRRRIWPFIVFPLVGVVLLLGVCAAIFVPRVIGQFKHPIDAANVYLADLRDARLPDAYTHLCTQGQSVLAYDQYVERLQAEEAQGGKLLRFNVRGAHVQAGHSDEAVVDVDVTTTRGQDKIQARMVNENGHWHWCGSGPAPKSTGIFIHIP